MDSSAGEGPSGNVAAPAPDAVDSSATQAVFELDADGAIATWPAPARALYGHEPTVARGKGLAWLVAEPARLDRPVDSLLEAAASGQAGHEETHRRADGSTFRAALTVSARGDGRAGYVAVSRDTTADRTAVRRLERRNDRLTEFTDMLVHDLRNPLHVVEQRLALYRETGNPDHLQSLDEAASRMERLVDDLLDVARQERAATDPEPTDVREVIDSAWEPIAVGPTDATLATESVPTVRADPDRLTELFENLFRNAVEHGSTGQLSEARGDAVERSSTNHRSQARGDAAGHGGSAVTVTVGTLPDGGFYVEDDGPGIPADMREEVFEHGVSTAERGTGYGLSVVRTVAEAHGWEVRATEGADGGARFEFTGIERPV